MGSIAKGFEVSVEEKAKSIDGSVYILKGQMLSHPETRFVVSVQSLGSGHPESTDRRMELCQIAGVDTADCAHRPFKSVTYSYEVLYETYSQPGKRGIRIDILDAVGISPEIVNSIAFPCTVLQDGSKVCGPNLGTCIHWAGSDRCDFGENLWTDLWKRWWKFRRG